VVLILRRRRAHRPCGVLVRRSRCVRRRGARRLSGRSAA